MFRAPKKEVATAGHGGGGGGGRIIVKIDRTAKRMMRRGVGATAVPRPTKVNEKDQDEGRECLCEDSSQAHGSG